jgi:hypothetical protein
VLSPYRAAEIIAKPFVEELLLAAKKRKANTPIETE